MEGKERRRSQVAPADVFCATAATQWHSRSYLAAVSKEAIHPIAARCSLALFGEQGKQRASSQSAAHDGQRTNAGSRFTNALDDITFLLKFTALLFG